MYRFLSLIFTVLILTFSAFGQDIHSSWDAMLKKNVSSKGVVNYDAFSSEKARLNDYINKISDANPKAMNRNDQMSFWINLYNAVTVQLIVDNYPIKSIKDIKQGDKGPWDIQLVSVEEKKYSLNDIEHKILRANYNDPRIHFGIVCASYSCPKLRNEAFKGAKLDTQLNEQARAFVNDENRNKIKEDNIQISQLFDWFKGDFTKSGTIINFLNQYSNVKIKDNATISYLDYNWSLNNK
jgi:hypothetical protein